MIFNVSILANLGWLKSWQHRCTINQSFQTSYTHKYSRENIKWGCKGSENRKRNAITKVSKQTIYGLLFLRWLRKVLVMIGEISAGNILRRHRTVSLPPLLKYRRGMKKKWLGVDRITLTFDRISSYLIYPFHYFSS